MADASVVLNTDGQGGSNRDCIARGILLRERLKLPLGSTDTCRANNEARFGIPSRARRPSFSKIQPDRLTKCGPLRKNTSEPTTFGNAA